MRTVFIGMRRGVALLALVVVLAVPAAYADDSNPLDQSPEARIHPPIGSSSSEAPSFFELLLDWAWLYARINPPIG